MMAGNVTPEQALEQARNFMQKREANGIRPRRGASVVQQFGTAKQVSGLYVFNIANNGGFVIVSNDDSAEAILGYSDNGNFDPNNMPENMKAWLQGYADEIAWAKERGITAKAARRTPSAIKIPISPLVQTKWNQGDPYNKQCPDFFTYGKSVTGCVATAMAQVMYYTETKAGTISSNTLKTIEAYDCERNWGSHIHVDAVPIGTAIEWSKMKNTYEDGETGDAADAVAKLMKVVGASVHMDYANADNGGSSANSDIVDDALKTYFGYATTTQLADRSYYSYSNWIDMLYNELYQERVIFYAGQSKGGGHAFLCDGYQGEDFFHINWGWGGKSDGFFKLAALNPDEQGIGGSSSTDGYSTGQVAVIGIQKDGETGTVSSHPNTVSLTLNSVATDKTSMTTDETAKITFNITNNSADEYDGEIGLYFIDEGLGDGEMFLIPAGESKGCVVEFSPSSAGTYKITAYKPNGVGRYGSIDNTKYVTITVTAGSESYTDNVTLTLTPIVEHADLYSSTTYKLYGKDFNAVIRVQNTSATDNYKGRLLWKLLPGSFIGDFNYEAVVINVPKNSYIDVPINVENLDMSETYYQFALTYRKNGKGATATWYRYYTNPAIMTYNADGSKTVTKASGASYAVPANTLAVDLTGTGITTVTSSTNPNCLYITDAATLSGATNIIKKSGSTYTATNITLTDGNDFYSPIDFTATNIEFTYNNDRWADGTNGWNTIILPFDVTSVTANGTAIDWFHSDSDTDKQFWLKKFVSDDVTGKKVFFDFTDEMKANTPYIIALPGNHWGTSYSLSGKAIKFIGSGEVKKSAPAVVTGSNYRFVGNTKAVSTENIYCINGAGNMFELKASGGSPAFRPFFKSGVFDRSVASLSIGFNGTTGIDAMLKSNDRKNDVYYDLNGRRVLYPNKGVYILNGKKVVIK